MTIELNLIVTFKVFAIDGAEPSKTITGQFIFIFNCAGG
jgi:hypothetical protein